MKMEPSRWLHGVSLATFILCMPPYCCWYSLEHQMCFISQNGPKQRHYLLLLEYQWFSTTSCRGGLRKCWRRDIGFLSCFMNPWWIQFKALFWKSHFWPLLFFCPNVVSTVYQGHVRNTRATSQKRWQIKWIQSWKLAGVTINIAEASVSFTFRSSSFSLGIRVWFKHVEMTSIWELAAVM